MCIKLENILLYSLSVENKPTKIFTYLFGSCLSRRVDYIYAHGSSPDYTVDI